MQNLSNIPKQYLIVGGVILVLLIIIGFTTFKGNSSQEVAEKETVFEEPAEVIPTVDSTVKATITGNTEAVIKVTGIPDGTDTIEYELSYSTEDGSIEGVFGEIEIDGKNSAEEEIIFGTSSSGVNRYHKIDGPVKGTFKFSGEYGQKLLEKEFEV